MTNGTQGLERAWWAVAMSSEVGDGDGGGGPVAVQLLGRWWALLRLGGEVVAFEDRCPHRLAPLSAGTIVDGTLRCAYHGWRFGPDGRAVAVPALGAGAPLPPRACAARPWGVVERHGLVWLAPSEPIGAVPDLPEWDDPSFERCWNSARRTPVGVHQLIDNFLDATHLGVVHTGTFGVDGGGALPAFEVARDGWSVGTTYRAPYKNHDDPLVATGEHDLVQPHELTKRFFPGAAATVHLFFPVTGRTLAILFAAQPESPTSSRIYKVMARDDGADLPATVAFEDQVFDEDLAILETYRSASMPLDVTVEVHTRADRLGVAFRRLVSEHLAAAALAPP